MRNLIEAIEKLNSPKVEFYENFIDKKEVIALIQQHKTTGEQVMNAVFQNDGVMGVDFADKVAAKLNKGS